MDKLYSDHGVQFLYPDSWELTEEVNDRDVVVSVTSPGTSFWTLSLLGGRPDPERVIREVLETFRGEYEELDEYPAEAKIADIDCEARDLQFVQYELISSAFLRAFTKGSQTALILYQGMDEELKVTRPILEAISASLKWDEPPSIIGYY